MKRIYTPLILIFIFITVSCLFLAPAQIFAPPSHIYVNSTIGNDSWDGFSPTYTGENNGPKETIASAITFMAAYGTIEIAAGTYNENLTINTTIGETLNLNGAGADSTIINGGISGSVFYITGLGSVIFNDLTITNGKSTVGGGISNGSPSSSGANVKIYNCVISDNEAYSVSPGNGGGIYNKNAKIEIYYSRIINNYSSQGGGAIFNDAGEVIIHYCSIYGNSSGINAGGIVDVNNTTVFAQNNWWGSSTGPSGGIADYGNPTIFANGSGDEISGSIYFYPWLTSDPFVTAASAIVEPVWVRTMPMTCYRVWINEDNKFQFIFWYPYRDNNWVRIYDMSGKEVYSMDMPYDNPNLIVDLPDGMYTVKTFTVGSIEPIQTFVIGKP